MLQQAERTGEEMSDRDEMSGLADQVARLVEAAIRAGADAADAVISRSRSASVSVRLGKVEGTEASDSDSVSLRVFVGKRVASVAAPAASPAETLALRAVAMARASPEDPVQGLAEPGLLAREVPDLDLFDPTEVDSATLKEAALAAEEAALAVPGVTNSGGSSAYAGSGGMVLATSDGFLGHYQVSRFSRSVSAIAGEGTGMERDYEFTSRIHFAELDDPERIGRNAGERAVRRLGARQVRTGKYPVVLDPRVARSIAGHLASAVNGASVARGSSFLRDRMGSRILHESIQVRDDPLRRRGPASRPFDGEGVAGEPLDIVDAGVLQHWLLSTSAGRQLGLPTNGRGARSGSSVVPAPTNFSIEPGTSAPEELVASVRNGFYATELFGQGVNLVTGEYSRGASGFWIENGELTYPVSEVTLASNLPDMFLNMIAASDLDRYFSIASPTLLIEGMTLAGN